MTKTPVAMLDDWNSNMAAMTSVANDLQITDVKMC